MVEELRELTYEKQLLSEKQIKIVLWVCREKISYKEIAKRLAIREATLRKYLDIIRRKLFENNFDHYIQQTDFIKDFDLGLLWEKTKDYYDIKHRMLEILSAK